MLKIVILSALSFMLISCGGSGGGTNIVSSDESTTDTNNSITTNEFQIEAWADNWFSAYLDDTLIVEDSVPITTEKSFNKETATFTGSYPLNLNFILKDFKENDTGLEYIGENNQQMGDGGFIMQIKDKNSQEIIAVSDQDMKCKVIHQAPLDKTCAQESDPIAGVGACQYNSENEPVDWKNSSYDTSGWISATEYSEAAVSPKDGYNEITWDTSAKLIWGSDLETDNTILCKLTINNPSDSDSSNTPVVASSRCETIQNSVDEFGDVSVTCDENYAYIKSNTFPDHDKMNGITGTNEQIPVPAKDYTSPIKLNPSGTTGKTTIDASLGVAVNGVPIYDYSSQGELDMDNYSYNASIDTLLLGQLDNCGGHAGRGDDYHYHARPTCMIDAISNKTDETIIGWMYDGYPLYDTKNPDSSSIASSDLDICNGQIDSTFGYRYHTSILAPYVPVCLRGSIDTNNLPRVAPMQGRTSGTPPQGGVSALSYTVNNGVTRMEYSYNGDTYYLQYSASNTADCYIFETKTVTDNGVVKTGEFCR